MPRARNNTTAQVNTGPRGALLLHPVSLFPAATNVMAPRTSAVHTLHSWLLQPAGHRGEQLLARCSQPLRLSTIPDTTWLASRTISSFTPMPFMHLGRSTVQPTCSWSLCGRSHAWRVDLHVAQPNASHMGWSGQPTYSPNCSNISK